MVNTVFDHCHGHLTSWHMSRDSVKMMSHYKKTYEQGRRRSWKDGRVQVVAINTSLHNLGGSHVIFSNVGRVQTPDPCNLCGGCDYAYEWSYNEGLLIFLHLCWYYTVPHPMHHSPCTTTHAPQPRPHRTLNAPHSYTTPCYTPSTTRTTPHAPQPMHHHPTVPNPMYTTPLQSYTAHSPYTPCTHRDPCTTPCTATHAPRRMHHNQMHHTPPYHVQSYTLVKHPHTQHTHHTPFATFYIIDQSLTFSHRMLPSPVTLYTSGRAGETLLSAFSCPASPARLLLSDLRTSVGSSFIRFFVRPSIDSTQPPSSTMQGPRLAPGRHATTVFRHPDQAACSRAAPASVAAASITPIVAHTAMDAYHTTCNSRLTGRAAIYVPIVRTALYGRH